MPVTFYGAHVVGLIRNSLQASPRKAYALRVQLAHACGSFSREAASQHSVSFAHGNMISFPHTLH